MCEFNPKNDSRRMDNCLIDFINFIRINLPKHLKTAGSCCGHGKYRATIIIKNTSIDDCRFELFTGKFIPRKKKFYKKDKQGYYYIPECIRVVGE